jgi:protein-S-isoprenylcysteine O-methyltransferase Ste14
MITVSGLREAGANVSAAVFYLAFAAVHVQGFAATGRPSLLVAVLIETLVAIMFLLRAPAERATSSPYAWVTTLGGTLLPLLLRPVAGDHDVLLGQVFQCSGGAFAVLSLAFLNRSFGLLPAVRLLRRGGPYRWLRHPIYAGYAVQNLGYLTSNASVRNLAVVVAALGFQVLRVYEEERLLASVPEYAAYMRQTRWRLLPLVF